MTVRCNVCVGDGVAPGVPQIRHPCVRCSWLVGYGDTYPDRIWHKPSYVSYIDWPLRGVDVYANWSAQQTSGKFKRFEYVQASKLDMEGPLIYLINTWTLVRTCRYALFFLALWLATFRTF